MRRHILFAVTALFAACSPSSNNTDSGNLGTTDAGTSLADTLKGPLAIRIGSETAEVSMNNNEIQTVTVSFSDLANADFCSEPAGQTVVWLQLSGALQQGDNAGGQVLWARFDDQGDRTDQLASTAASVHFDDLTAQHATGSFTATMDMLDGGTSSLSGTFDQASVTCQ